MEARANEDWGDRSSEEEAVAREDITIDYSDCPLCGGSGDDPDDPTFTCPRCNGAGEVKE
jgi:DnaJ-class molecular chaperone